MRAHLVVFRRSVRTRPPRRTHRMNLGGMVRKDNRTTLKMGMYCIHQQLAREMIYPCDSAHPLEVIHWTIVGILSTVGATVMRIIVDTPKCHHLEASRVAIALSAQGTHKPGWHSTRKQEKKTKFKKKATDIISLGNQKGLFIHSCIFKHSFNLAGTHLK